MTPAARLLALPVRAYRAALSPLLPARCRFAPTCSSYALEALHEHGAARGGWLAVRRVARCHPFHPGGHDPVPPRRSSTPPSTAVRPAGTAAGGIGDDGLRAAPVPLDPAPALGARS